MMDRAARRNAARLGRNRTSREAALSARSPTTTIYDETTCRMTRVPARQDKRDGLEWLRSKGHISHDEYHAGLWFADRHRWAKMGDATPIPSCLGDARGGGTGGLPSVDLDTAERIANARADYVAIEARVCWDAGLQLALLFVCVHGLRLSEAAMTRTEEAVTIGEFRATLGHLARLKKEREKTA